MDDRSLGEGCQPDGITVHGGRLDRGIFPTVTRGRVPNPNQNCNLLAWEVCLVQMKYHRVTPSICLHPGKFYYRAAW